MKNIIVLFIALTSIQAAKADMCDSSEALADAQNHVEEVQKNFSVGAANKFDILVAQKHVLDLTLCKNSMDTVAYKQLAENAQSRLVELKALVKAGVIAPYETILTSGEIAGLSQGCPSILKSIKDLYAVGEKTRQDISNIQSACAILNEK